MTTVLKLVTRATATLFVCTGLCVASTVPAADGKRPAVTLGAIQSLKFPSGPGAGEPYLTTDPSGNVYASWFEKAGETGHALKVSKLSGSGWSAPYVVASGDSFFVNWADTPILVAMGGKRLALSWPWKSSGGTYSYDVRIAQSFDDGKTWGAPITPHRDNTPTEHGFVSMIPAGDRVRVVWLDGRKTVGASEHHGDEHGNAEMTLRTATIGRNGVLTEEAELDGRVCDCCPTAMISVGSNALLAYRDRSGDEVRDFAVMRLAGGAWSEAKPLGRDNWKINACPVNGAALDAAGDRVVAAWYTGANDDPAVYVAFSSDAGKTFAAPVRVDSAGSKGTLGRVDVVTRADGAALVTWIHADAGSARILAREISPYGVLSAPIIVAVTSAKRASGFPRMTRSGDRVIFAWTEAGEPSQVRAASAKWNP
jgi:hypothetical protein